MAIRLASAADYLQRTADLIGTGAQTWMAWVRYTTLPPTKGTIFAALDALPAVYTQAAGVFAYPDRFDFEITGVATPPSFAAPVAGTWYHACWTKSATTANIFYVNATSVGTETAALPFAPAAEVVGGDSFSDGLVELAYVRRWNATLTLAQIQSEMFAQHAIRTTSLWQDTPLTTDLLDVSGNGRDWTQVGSGVFVANPTNVPSNRHVADAIALPLPPFDTSVTVPANFPRSAASRPSLWFKFTAPTPADEVLGLWPYTTGGALFVPETLIWLGPDLDNLQAYVNDGFVGSFDQHMAEDVNNAPLSIPTRDGVTYYLQIFNGGASQNTVDETLQFSGRRPPNTTVPAGSVMVSDDTGYFPLAALNPSTGAVLNLIRFRSDSVIDGVGNESDDTLPSGIVLAEDVALSVFHLYNRQYDEIATIPYPATFGSPASVGELNDIVTNRSDAFYVASQVTGFASIQVIKISDAGVISPTTWALPAGSANVQRVIAPDPAETFLYHGKYLNTDNQIDKWDLATNNTLGMFVASVANYRLVRDILVLSTGQVVVGYQRNAGTGQQFARLYNADGTTVRDVEFGLSSSVLLNRMAFDAGVTDTFFWVWLQFSADQTSQFLKVRVSDGTIALSSPILPWFEIGSHRGTVAADPPRFGHSQSCPFWIQQVNSDGPNPPPPTPTTACPPVSWLRAVTPGCVAIGEL